MLALDQVFLTNLLTNSVFNVLSTFLLRMVAIIQPFVQYTIVETAKEDGLNTKLSHRSF